MASPEDLKKMYTYRPASGDQVAAHHEIFTPGLILAETINKHTPDGAVKDLAQHLILTACYAALGAIAVSVIHEPVPEEPAPSAPETGSAPFEESGPESGVADESPDNYPAPTGEGDGV